MKKMKGVYLLSLLLFLLFGAAVGVNAALPVINITVPLNDTSISGTGADINVTITAAGETNITNMSVYYQSTRNSSLQAINTTVTNSTADQETWNFSWDSTSIVDSNITIVVNFTYNNGTAVNIDTSSARVKGVIVDNTDSAVTLVTPTADYEFERSTSNKSLNFSATTNELYNGLVLVFNGADYTMTSNAENTTWGITVDGIPHGSYNWYVKGNTIDDGVDEITPTSANTFPQLGRALLITSPSGYVPEDMGDTTGTGGGKSNVLIAIVVIGAIWLLSSAGKKKR